MQIVLGAPPSHLSLIFGHNQFPMRRVWIQNHAHCRGGETRFLLPRTGFIFHKTSLCLRVSLVSDQLCELRQAILPASVLGNMK